MCLVGIITEKEMGVGTYTLFDFTARLQRSQSAMRNIRIRYSGAVQEMKQKRTVVPWAALPS